VVREAESLFSRGVGEINLIGQDTTAYGEDLGIEGGLPRLLERLAGLENAGWIRFLYAYPNRVTQRLLDTIAAHPALCKYIDIPLQHASGAVLKRMKRGASGDIFLKLIERIRRTIPGVGIRTSFIVGFPGETGADFAEVCQFVEAAQFDRVGVFRYSDDETSESFRLDDKVDNRTIYNRQRRLMALQKRISRARNRRLVGGRYRILITGPSPETELLWEGRLETQAEEIDGKTYLTDVGDIAPKPGSFGVARITRASDYDLFGVLERVEAAPQMEFRSAVQTPSALLPILQ
jgi:ribosomal protein S12 methylthiotransferase